MVQNATKHPNERVVVLDNQAFAGGMNNSSPADGLNDQVPLLLNVYRDAASGMWRTRPPFVRYSASAPSANPITGITYWHGQMIYECNGSLYYDPSSPTLIGALNGNEPPSFQPFNGFLCVASGGVPQKVNTSYAIADITGTAVPADSLCLIEKNGQLGLVGNTNYPDYYYESVQYDETTWSGTTSAYYSVGWKDDDLETIGVTHGPYGYVIIWKRGTSGKSTWFLDPNETSPVARLVTENEVAHTFRSAVYAANKLWIMDKVSGPLAFAGTDATEKIIIDPGSLEVGSRVLNSWSMDTSAFAVVYPPHGQIWFFNAPASSNAIWVLHYRVMAWSKFIPAGSLTFRSAYYNTNDGVLYLGATDGYIYKYDVSSTAFSDYPAGAATNYPQMWYSKIYETDSKHNEIIKQPLFSYRSLAAGSGTIEFYKHYGHTSSYTYSFTMPDDDYRMSDWDDDLMPDVDDIRMATTSVATERIQDDIRDLDNFQVQVAIASGGLEFHNLVIPISPERLTHGTN